MKKNHGMHNADTKTPTPTPTGIQHRQTPRRAALVGVASPVDVDSELCTQPDDELSSLVQADIVVSRRMPVDQIRADTVSLFQADFRVMKKGHFQAVSAPVDVDSELCTEPDSEDSELSSLMQADVVVSKRSQVDPDQ